MEIIVDLCNQHHGDIKELKRMALSAFMAGADVVKVQLMDSEKFFGDTNRKYRDISYDDLHEISSFCDFIGVEFMASVFDEERLEWLDGTYIKRHKIASRTAAKDPELAKRYWTRGSQQSYQQVCYQKVNFPMVLITCSICFAFLNIPPSYMMSSSRRCQKTSKGANLQDIVIIRSAYQRL